MPLSSSPRGLTGGATSKDAPLPVTPAIKSRDDGREGRGATEGPPPMESVGGGRNRG